MKKTGLADSPFFTAASPSGEVFSREAPPERKSERTEDRTDFRSENRTVDLPPIPERRNTRRYSFEFYDDQILKLKHLKYQAEIAGKRVNLSDFAREALDQYLKDK